VARGRILYKVS
jgi:aldehyde dehydrogenase (NAD+)